MSNLPSYDLAIIGSGPGGYAAAVRARRLGWRVALIERAELGGVCLNVGCIPTKALITVGHTMRQIRRAHELGIHVEGVRLDYAAAIQRNQRIIATLRQGLLSLLKAHQVELIVGEAAFDDAHTLRISHHGQTQSLTCARAIIATGAHPSPGPWSFDGQHILSYRELLSLTSLPSSLLIIGGGVIGCEFASCFSSLGVPVTIVEQEAQLLPTEDAEAVRVLARSLQARGVMMHTQASVQTLTASATGVRAVLSTGVAVEAQRCLIAIGLRPNSEALGLEALGIRTEHGVEVCEGLLTAQPHIAAIGDCIHGGGLAHLASAEGILAVENVAASTSRALDCALIPRCVYTDPEIAQVGLLEAACDRAGTILAGEEVPRTAGGAAQPSVRVSRFSFAALGKSLCDDESDGFVKLLIDPATDRVLGATIVGAQASTLIHLAVVAMAHGLTAQQLARTVTAHPTLAEGLTEAAAQFYGEALYTAGSARPARSAATRLGASSHV